MCEPFHSCWMFQSSVSDEKGDSTLKTGKSEAADLVGWRWACGW